MHSCYLHPALWDPASIVIAPEETHYLLRVCRVKNKEQVRVFDGRGRSLIASVNLDHNKRDGLILKTLHINPMQEPAVKIILLQAIPKGNRMDTIVEKTTELGVWELWPILTERCVKKPLQNSGKNYSDRLRRIALAAARQCGTDWVPTINTPVDIKEALTAMKGVDLMIAGVISPRAIPLRDLLEKNAIGASGRICCFIGPEGDFTPDETALLLSSGVEPANLGKLILRTDTAGIYMVSALKYEYLDRGR